LSFVAVVALLFATAQGPALDPDLLNPAKRQVRYYSHIDLLGWSSDSSLVYEATSVGEDLDVCGTGLSWQTRVRAFRTTKGTTVFRVAAEARKAFRARPIEVSLQETRKNAGCSAEDSAVSEYDSAAPADDGAARLAQAGALTRVCRVDSQNSECVSPDGVAAIRVERSATNPDARRCRTDHVRYLLRTTNNRGQQLAAFTGQPCARNTQALQISWSPDSRRVAIAANAESRGLSAMSIMEFARLDVFDVPAK
jgi:hypothetical protein